MFKCEQDQDNEDQLHQQQTNPNAGYYLGRNNIDRGFRLRHYGQDKQSQSSFQQAEESVVLPYLLKENQI